jgi:DNA polymerase-4
VAEELGLTCSVGVAPTKFVAKLASARCKPDGLLVVPAADVLRFLHPLPVTVLWGVGSRTAEQLHRLGVRTVADLADTPLPVLRRAVGTAVADHLHELAHGRDPRTVQVGEQEKSVSSDHTLDADVQRELLRLADDVGRRLRRRQLVARTVGIKIRFADFRTVTRVRTLPGWTDSSATIFGSAVELYRALDLDRPRVRLVGVMAENLRARADAPEQLSFDDVRPGPAADAVAGAVGVPAVIDPVIDAARARFGGDALGYATLLRAPRRGDGGGRAVDG